jgi:hypothetical protein
MNMKAIIATVLFLLPNVALAGRETAFAGTWTGDCADDVKCTTTFTISGTGYEMHIAVTDIKDESEIVCSADAHLSKVAWDVLTGDPDGYDLKVVMSKTGDVVVSGLPSDECSGADWNSRYKKKQD